MTSAGADAATVVHYEIAGRMGRAYLMLPCRHQRASLADPYSHGPKATRKCLRCGSRYRITLDLGTGLARVERLKNAIGSRDATRPGARLTTADVRRLLDDRWDA